LRKRRKKNHANDKKQNRRKKEENAQQRASPLPERGGGEKSEREKSIAIAFGDYHEPDQLGSRSHSRGASLFSADGSEKRHGSRRKTHHVRINRDTAHGSPPPPPVGKLSRRHFSDNSKRINASLFLLAGCTFFSEAPYRRSITPQLCGTCAQVRGADPARKGVTRVQEAEEPLVESGSGIRLESTASTRRAPPFRRHPRCARKSAHKHIRLHARGCIAAHNGNANSLARDIKRLKAGFINNQRAKAEES